MKEELQKLNAKIVEAEDGYLLKLLSAKKGEIKIRADLKNYSFTCPICEKVKPAMEAIRLVGPLKIDSKKLKKTVEFTVTQGMLLICQNCQVKHYPIPEYIE